MGDAAALDEKEGARPLINAAPRPSASPAFRAAASAGVAWCRWTATTNGKPPADAGGRKTPFYFFRTDGSPLLVAGLWEAAESALTCTVITTDAVGELRSVHDRMPLILGERDWDR